MLVKSSVASPDLFITVRELKQRRWQVFIKINATLIGLLVYNLFADMRDHAPDEKIYSVRKCTEGKNS